MSKLTLTNIANLQNETTAVNAINTNNAAIIAAIDNTLSRDGTPANQMAASLDMNSNQILNLPTPLSNYAPLRVIDAATISGGGITVSPLPVGGTTGQFLGKNSSTNFDTSWQFLATDAVNVKSSPYLAKGDGVTNDQAAITAATAAAVAANKALYFPSGVYAHSATLQFGYNGLNVVFDGRVTLLLTGASTINVSIDAGPLTTNFINQMRFGVGNAPILKGNATTTRNLYTRGLSVGCEVWAQGADCATTATGFEIVFGVSAKFNLEYNNNTGNSLVYPMATKPAIAIAFNPRSVGEPASACIMHLVVDSMTEGVRVAGNGCQITGFSENNTGDGFTLNGALGGNATVNTITGWDAEGNGGHGIVCGGNTAENTFVACGVASSGGTRDFLIQGSGNSVFGGTYDTITDTGFGTSFYSVTYNNVFTPAASAVWVNLFNAVGFTFSSNLGTTSFAGSTSGQTILKASAVASGTLTLPAATDTLVGRATVDTLTNKTISSPIIAAFNSGGQVLNNAVPAGTDTLVARTTTDTLTNKTLTTPTIASFQGGSAAGSGVTIKSTTNGTPSADFITLQADTVNIGSITGGGATNVTFGSAGAQSATVSYTGSTSGITGLKASAVASGTLTLPAATDTLVGKATTDTLTNKTLTSPAFTGTATGAGTIPGSVLSLSPITNSIGADVLLNNTGLYFDGPSIAQGTSGTWFVTGSVTVLDTAGPANMAAKLWDGTTVVDSGFCQVTIANGAAVMAFSGFITSPAGNLRISVKDSSATTGKMMANLSANGKDSTITAIRIA